MSDPDSSSAPDERALIARTVTSTGRTLGELSMERPVLVVFLRHSGCTFCREAMGDLAAGRSAIEGGGASLVLVHMSAAEDFAKFAEEYGLGDVPAISDPDRILYRGLGLRRGRLRQLLGLRVWWRGYQSWRAGNAAGLWAGDAAQMPGVFLIDRGRVVRRFVHATAGDRPDYPGLCQLPQAP